MVFTSLRVVLATAAMLVGVSCLRIRARTKSHALLQHSNLDRNAFGRRVSQSQPEYDTVADLRNYAEYDKKGKGFLTEEAFKHFANQLPPPVGEREKLLETVDVELKTDEGTLPLEVLETAMQQEPDLSDHQSLLKLFVLFSKDELFITPEDLFNYMNGNMTLGEARESIRTSDSCGYGYLDFSDFKIMMGQKRPFSNKKCECVVDISHLYCCADITEDGRCPSVQAETNITRWQRICPGAHKSSVASADAHASCQTSWLGPSIGHGIGGKCWCQQDHCYNFASENCVPKRIGRDYKKNANEISTSVEKKQLMGGKLPVGALEVAKEKNLDLLLHQSLLDSFF